MLYFKFLKYFMMIFFLLSILALPSFATYASQL